MINTAFIHVLRSRGILDPSPADLSDEINGHFANSFTSYIWWVNWWWSLKL